MPFDSVHFTLADHTLSLSLKCCKGGAKCCPQCLGGGGREGGMQMESDAWEGFPHFLQGWQRMFLVLSCNWCCPSRSISPTRSAEQVGQSEREFPFSHMEERKYVVWLLKVIEASYWRLSNQPLGIGHINLLYAYESLFHSVLFFFFFFSLRCRKEWSAGVWSMHRVFGWHSH